MSIKTQGSSSVRGGDGEAGYKAKGLWIIVMAPLLLKETPQMYHDKHKGTSFTPVHGVPIGLILLG